MSEAKAYRVIVLAPVYDDAEAAANLLTDLERAFEGTGLEPQVLLVDDGSPVPLISRLRLLAGHAALPIQVLRLRRNLGHQRAIAVGMAYVHDHLPCDALLVMDADGEDRPADGPHLLARCRELGEERIVFARRTRRSESVVFQLLYRLYQALHWLATGVRVRVGNFSVVPARRLPALVTLPALWNHYAAAVFQARLPLDLLPTVRGLRYRGRSKMNFVGLVMHGLQAISVFSDIVAVRALVAVSVLACACSVLLAVTMATQVWSGFLVPVWAPYAVGGSLILILILALASFSLALSLLAQRNSLDFIPIRDYRFFIEDLAPLTPAHE